MSDQDPVTSSTRFTEALKKRRQQQPTLADDQSTRFDKHDAARAAARSNTTAHDERVRQQEEQRQRWTGLSTTPTTASGVKLDAETAKLKAASDASRLAARQPRRTINLSTLRACVWVVMQTHAEWFQSAFNVEMLNRMIQHLLKAGGEVCPELVEEAYQRCVENHHFELSYTRDPATGGRVSKRGDASLVPPTPVQPCIWPDEAALIRSEEQAEVILLNSEEAQRALTMTFEELQKQARKTFKRGGNEDVR